MCSTSTNPFPPHPASHTTHQFGIQDTSPVHTSTPTVNLNQKRPRRCRAEPHCALRWSCQLSWEIAAGTRALGTAVAIGTKPRERTHCGCAMRLPAVSTGRERRTGCAALAPWRSFGLGLPRPVQLQAKKLEFELEQHEAIQVGGTAAILRPVPCPGQEFRSRQ